MTKHVTVYRQPGRFAGWPANHGIWQWGDEILVGFAVGRFLDREGKFHAIDMRAPRGITFGRSLDGGETWKVEDGATAGLAAACYHHTLGDVEPKPCPGRIDFSCKGFAAMFGRMDNARGPSHFHLSPSKGRTWYGPYILPDMGTPGLAARTNYIVEGPKTMLVFLTCAKKNGREGDTFCARTTDGGRTWQNDGYIVQAPVEKNHYCIMPSAVRLDDGRIVCAVRHQWETSYSIAEWPGTAMNRMSSVEIIERDVAGWHHRARVGLINAHSSPGWLVDLKDGRVCCVYTVRKEPYRICAVIASIHTLDFGPEIVLCDDAVSQDVGYTVAVRRPDGKLVIIYYWHDSDENPERYIRVTIWEPPC